jgi:hypothetical protein
METSKTKTTPVVDKLQYAFCILLATLFISRCIASWFFNI